MTVFEGEPRLTDDQEVLKTGNGDVTPLSWLFQFEVDGLEISCL